MKPLQLLTTIPFWATSRRSSRIILPWVLGTLTPPLHTVSQIQLLRHGRDSKEADNASHPLGFSVPRGTFAMAHAAGAVPGAPGQQVAVPSRESRGGSAGALAGLSPPCPQLGDAAAGAPPLVSMVSRLSRNTSTLKHLCLNKSLSLTVSCGTTCAVLHTKERAQDLTDSSAKFLLSTAAHRKQSRGQN